MKQHLARLVAGIVLVLAVSTASAHAAPVTVNLRVEGPVSTFFEQSVTTDATTIAGHPCNYADNGSPAPGGSPQPTPTGALVSSGLSLSTTWYPSFNDTVTDAISGVTNDPTFSPSWNVSVNGVTLSAGGCQVILHAGDAVLWSYQSYGDALLRLSGPTVANVGQATRYSVVNTDSSNAPVSGATVNGATTDASGVANVTFASAGSYTFKATKSGAVRSNAITVCVHNGNDGTCGSPLDPNRAPTVPAHEDTKAPIASIAGLRNRQHFHKGKGPRELKGSVTDTGAVKSVELRLRRQTGKRCFSFSGDAEKFTKIRCKRDASWFAIGSSADWSYLLPSKLPSGLYQLQVRATDAAGNQSRVRSLRFRVA